MIEIGEIKYSIRAKPTTKDGMGWFRRYVELEKWCKENIGDRFYVAKPSPNERIFVFDDEEDAMAFKLTWQD